MACHLFGTKPILTCHHLNPQGQTLQWNLNQNTKLFSQEIASENVCKMSAILLRPPRGNKFLVFMMTPIHQTPNSVPSLLLHRRLVLQFHFPLSTAPSSPFLPPPQKSHFPQIPPPFSLPPFSVEFRPVSGCIVCCTCYDHSWKERT